LSLSVPKVGVNLVRSPHATTRNTTREKPRIRAQKRALARHILEGDDATLAHIP